jgi:hypothetical protein
LLHINIWRCDLGEDGIDLGFIEVRKQGCTPSVGSG